MSRFQASARGAAAALLVVLAVVLAILGRDALAWRGQTERTNVAIAHFSRSQHVGQPGTWLPVALSRAVLGTGDDVSVARALQRLQLLRGSGRDVNRFDPPSLELASLELTFDEIADGPGPTSMRSRARELHAILVFQQLVLQTGLGQASTALDRAITEMQRAVRIDPRDTEAQTNLETLLILYKPIATELAGERAYRKTNQGNVGAAGGSPGAVGALGGY